MKKKKLFFASLSSLLLLALTSCDSDKAAGNISGAVEGKVENVLPNLFVALAQLGAFLVMVFIFFKFAYKPIKKKLKYRQDHVQNEVNEAREKNLKAERNLEDSEMNIKESHARGDRIVQEANKAAELKAQEIIDKANSQAEEIRRQSEIDAEEKLKEVERVAHDQILTSAIAASKEILGRELTKEDNDKVVEEFIDKMKGQ